MTLAQTTRLSVGDIQELRTDDGLYLMAKGHHEPKTFLHTAREYMACEWGDDWEDWYQWPPLCAVESGWGRYQIDPDVTGDKPGQIALSDVGHRVTSLRGVFPYTTVSLDEKRG